MNWWYIYKAKLPRYDLGVTVNILLQDSIPPELTKLL